MSDASPAAPGTAPFAHLRPAALLASAYFTAILVWLVAGDALPGGRWLAVHLFTAGALTTLIVVLAQHFAETVLHVPSRGGVRGRLVLVTGGALALLAGFPQGWRWAVVAGAVAQTVAVTWLYVDLRRMRKTSMGSRFTFVVRGYERAGAAFLHGALLGALLGTGVLGGAWHAAGRLAHLHVNVLGWGGLTLLATAVFFGPTILRARMEPGADAAAARALRHGMTGLTAGVLALLLTGAGDPWALPARLLGAAGLAVYAAGVSVVCGSVLRAARRARRSAHGWSLTAACVWFPLVVWADVLVVATGRWDLLDALGVALLAGVLGQAILASLGYLTPMVWRPGPQARQAARERLEWLGRARPIAFNAGVAAVVAGAVSGLAGGDAGAVLRYGGWALVGAVTAVQLVLMAAVALGARMPAERAPAR